ncbi:MAG TPA: M56 family metallopeptidase, partial [Gemmataceae bacterium]|nr:M56 family metallopeptidase [Gemmataceae bacterium]
MQSFWVLSEEWFLRSALGGSLILFLTWLLLRRTEQPARQQRLAEWGMGAALCVAALAWLHPWATFPIYQKPDDAHHASLAEPFFPATAYSPGETTSQSYSPVNPPLDINDTPSYLADGDDEWITLPKETQDDAIWPEPANKLLRSNEAPAANLPSPDAKKTLTNQEKTSAGFSAENSWLNLEMVLRGLVSAYILGASIFLVRWILGQLAVTRLIRGADLPPRRLTEMLVELSQRGRLPPRLLVSDSVSVPLCFGVRNPTIILPRSMVEAGSAKVLRWVLCHELTHLERRDSWRGLLFNVGKVLYYYLPWFWQLRRRASLCQEYLADAAAAQTETRLDYAQFLLGITRMPALPAGATGVSGYSSDLFRRITMLLRNPIVLDRRVPRLWSLATGCCLLALAVLLSGVGLTVSAAPAEQPQATKDEPKKDEPKKDEPKKEETKKENAGDAAKHSFEEIQQRLKDVQLDRQKALDKMREEMDKLQAELRKNMPQFPAQARLFNGVAGVAVAGGGYPGFSPHEGRRGVRVQKPSDTLAEQLDLP